MNPLIRLLARPTTSLFLLALNCFLLGYQVTTVASEGLDMLRAGLIVMLSMGATFSFATVRSWLG